MFSKSSDSGQGYTPIPPRVNYYAWAEAEASADESGWYSVWAQVGDSKERYSGNYQGELDVSADADQWVYFWQEPGTIFYADFIN